MPNRDGFYTCGGCATLYDTPSEAARCFDQACPHDEDGLPLVELDERATIQENDERGGGAGE